VNVLMVLDEGLDGVGCEFEGDLVLVATLFICTILWLVSG
jgi:hypothetical protein